MAKKASKPTAAGLSTGSTLLNLAITGRLDIGYECGTYNYFVGDSNSGKSFFCMSSLAEAANLPAFDDYRLIYDNVEDGIKMDVERYFGRKLVERLEPPASDEDGPLYSDSIEEFYFNVDDALEAGKPFVYVLDSMDALSSEGQQDHFQKLKKAVRRNADKLPGSYGDGKAKANSQNIRLVAGRLRKTRSILLVISQTRDNIDAGLFASKKTRSGGRALSFWAQSEVWSSVREKIKVGFGGKDRQAGTLCEMKVRRSRLSGHEATVQVPILLGAGIDDTGSLVDFLVEEGVWKKVGGGYIDTRDLCDEDIKLQRDDLIQRIEEDGLENELKLLVLARWREIEAALTAKRKSRYQ